MDSGRMPACDSVPFDGRATTSVRGRLTQGDNKQRNPIDQLKKYDWGNKCGHDKNSFKKPNYPSNHKRRPHCLEEGKRRLELAILHPFRYPDATGLFFHRNADRPEGREQARDMPRSNRRRRSEGVEGIFSLALPTLLHTLNLHKMACGFYDSGQNFHYYDYHQLQEISGQTIVRFKREMKFLQDNEIVKVSTIREMTHDGVWRTKETRIEFTDKIFFILGLMSEFLRDRETLAIKFYKKQSNIEKNQKKRDFYRKTSFSASKIIKKDKINPTSTQKLQTSIKGLIRRVAPESAGNGVEVRDRINALVRQGVSIKDAMEIVKQQYPPKH